MLSNVEGGIAEADARLERELPVLVAAELEQAVLEKVLGDLVVEPADADMPVLKRGEPRQSRAQETSSRRPMPVLLEVLGGVLAADVEEADVVQAGRGRLERRRAPLLRLPVAAASLRVLPITQLCLATRASVPISKLSAPSRVRWPPKPRISCSSRRWKVALSVCPKRRLPGELAEVEVGLERSRQHARLEAAEELLHVGRRRVERAAAEDRGVAVLLLPLVGEEEVELVLDDGAAERRVRSARARSRASPRRARARSRPGSTRSLSW